MAPSTTTSRGVAQQTAASTAPMAPVVISVLSRMAASALRRRRVARIGGRGGERRHIGLAVVIGHDGRLVLEGYRDIGHPRHPLKTLFDDEGAVRAVHVLNRESDGFLPRQSGRCGEDTHSEGCAGEKLVHGSQPVMP